MSGRKAAVVGTAPPRGLAQDAARVLEEGLRTEHTRQSAADADEQMRCDLQARTGD